ncbi:MAG: tetratricopeptide repeat protein [Betaproteobacteria bacterium]|nr:tetratricopeptide repeat protein [Betaproteobacteria bacterium]
MPFAVQPIQKSLIGRARAVMFAMLCLPFGVAAQASADLVAEARKLIEAKQFSQAYALLAPLENARAGDAQFDYWLGVAALETDQLERAASAFERALLRQPDFDSARLELGRVYLRMGALDLAEHEFRRLLDRAPTPEGRKLLEDYLAAIQKAKAKQRFSLKGYLEAGGGRDNNLTSTTRDFTNAIENSFGIPGITPTGNSIRRSAAFASAATGMDAVWRQSESGTLFAGADLRWRGYREFDDFDYLLADLNLGYQARRGELTYTAIAFGQSFRQDGAFVETLGADRVKNNRNTAGLQFEVRRDITATSQLAVGLGLSSFRYPSNAGQDTDQLLMGVTWVHRPSFWRGTTLATNINYTVDEAKRPLNEFSSTEASRHATAVRVTLSGDPAQQLNWSASLGYTVRIDDDRFARSTLVSIGRDELLEFSLRGAWRLSEGWSVQPYLAILRNRSNIALYAFDKVEGGVSVRREFK